MDVGRVCTVKFFDMYPHRRLDDLHAANEHKDASFSKCKYLAIRCCLSGQLKSFSPKSINLFYNATFTAPKVTLTFELVEQVRIGSVTCWVTNLYVRGESINKRIISCELHNQPKDKFKAIKEHLRLQNTGAQSSSPNPSLSEPASSLSNREWLDIEARALDVAAGGERRSNKRASSLNEYNDEVDKSEADEVAKTFHCGQQIEKEKGRSVNFQRPLDGEEKKKSRRKENRRRSKSVENSKKRMQQQQQMLMQQENAAHSLSEHATDSFGRNEVSSRMRSDHLNNYYAGQQIWVVIKLFYLLELILFWLN